ncbi:hypothetical protein BLOT_013322 [Blomia tropicalis]|nr:hypothetical protein BLOT_013322 [Blomia tropicalis]
METISLVLLFNFFESIHFGWLYLFPRKNISEQYYNFDLTSIAEVPKEINLMIIGVLLYSGHYIYIMYFCDYNELHQILFQILVSRNTSGIFRFPRMNSKRLLYYLDSQLFHYILWMMQQSLQLIVTKWHSFKRCFKPKFLLFIREYIHTLRMLMNANGLYGITYSTYLMVHNPLNCLLMSALLLNDLSLYVKLFIIAFAAHQFMANLGIHLMMAVVNNKFSKSCKAFIGTWMKQSQKMVSINIRTRIKVDCFVFAFNTKKKYGLTYYKIALISLLSYSKYFILYSELMMVGINFINQNKIQSRNKFSKLNYYVLVAIVLNSIAFNSTEYCKYGHFVKTIYSIQNNFIFDELSHDGQPNWGNQIILVIISEVPKEINLMIICVLLYSGHYIYLMYFCEYKKLNQILFRILVSQNTFGIFRFLRMNSKRLVWQDIQFKSVALFCTILIHNCSLHFYGWYKLLIAEFNIILFTFTFKRCFKPKFLLFIREYIHTLLNHAKHFIGTWMKQSQKTVSINIRTRIKVDYFVFAFHTKKKYGLTYYKTALISLLSYSKYLILYSELMMVGINF